MSVDENAALRAVALAGKPAEKKPAAPAKAKTAAKTKSPPKPEQKAVPKVTSAAKPKSESVEPTKPAAKAVKAGPKAVLTAEAKPTPPKAAKAAVVAEVPKAFEPAVKAEAAKPVETSLPQVAAAPAPQSHSGVISGPMRPMTPPRAMAKAEIFVDGDFVVYPTHGVGKVERIATEEIAGHTLELIHITFDENRMTLRVPTNKARTAGLRKLASRKQFDDVLATLKGRARIKRTMWSRRAQEYEAKINSGDPQSIAEVVRDLHRNAGQPDQSFSERQIYESALDRLAAEYGALEQVDKATATERLIAHLKSE
jgi:CarD family transcriptional regulator